MNDIDLKKDIVEKCRFCYPPDKYRILNSSKNFYVMLSLGPIVEGYLLIVTKDHIKCCAEIPSHLQGEFISLANEVEKILIEKYGGCIFYEHGQAGACLNFKDSSKHCYHAHMHCVPISGSINRLITNPFPKKEVKSWEDFFKIYSYFQEPYFFVQDNEAFFYIANDSPERQYLRKKAAKLCDNKEAWDWIKFPNYELITAGQQNLSNHFKKLSNAKG